MGQVLIKQEISVHNVKIDNNTNKVQGKEAAEGTFNSSLMALNSLVKQSLLISRRKQAASRRKEGERTSLNGNGHRVVKIEDKICEDEL